MSESKLVYSCIKWLYAQGCYVWRNNTGAYKPEKSKRYIRYGLSGSSDIIGLTPSGRFIGVECKWGNNKLTDNQKKFRDRIENNNGIYVTAYSIDDLEKVKEVICSKKEL